MLLGFAIVAQTPQAADPLAGAWIGHGATAILAGVVVWLAKAYRDDMKERAAASLVSHEKVAAEFKRTSEETRDKFLTSLDGKNAALESLCESVEKLTTHVSTLSCKGKS